MVVKRERADQNVQRVFLEEKNRTLGLHHFFSRMQQPRETLYMFWHALDGLAAPCDFGEMTTILVLDMFILLMTNKKIQEKLCAEPKEPEQALEFAIAFQEGTKMQKSYGTQNTDTLKTSVKSEPIFAVEELFRGIVSDVVNRIQL